MASVAATAAHTAEVSGLNQSLERAEAELGRLKRQLEDQQVLHKSCLHLVRTNFQYDRICVMICARGDDRSRGSEEGCCQAEEKAAAEQALREKHEAKVVEAKREL